MPTTRRKLGELTPATDADSLDLRTISMAALSIRRPEASIPSATILRVPPVLNLNSCCQRPLSTGISFPKKKFLLAKGVLNLIVWMRVSSATPSNMTDDSKSNS